MRLDLDLQQLLLQWIVVINHGNLTYHIQIRRDVMLSAASQRERVVPWIQTFKREVVFLILGFILFIEIWFCPVH